MENLFVKNNIKLKPILLGGLFKLMGQEPDMYSSLPILKANYMREDIRRQAELYSVPLSFHDDHPLSSLKAMRLLQACKPDLREKLSAVLYKAYWQEQKNITDNNFIAKLSQDFCISALEYEDAKMLLKNSTAEAFSRRVFGVPTLYINNRYYFGSDRLELALKALDLTENHGEWTPGKTLDFYFDFTSPYSYLAYQEVKKALKKQVIINFKPILLGALFKHLGQNNAPMLVAHPHKAAYYLQDMQDWAHARGASFVFNNNFPLKTVNALRAALVEPESIDPIFHAAWAENKNISDDSVLKIILDNAGLNGDLIMAETSALILKKSLKPGLLRP